METHPICISLFLCLLSNESLHIEMEPRLLSDTAVRKQHYFIVNQSQLNMFCQQCGGYVRNNHHFLFSSLLGLSSLIASWCLSSLFVQTLFSTFQPEAPESTALNIHAAITQSQTPFATFWEMTPFFVVEKKFWRHQELAVPITADASAGG